MSYITQFMARFSNPATRSILCCWRETPLGLSCGGLVFLMTLTWSAIVSAELTINVHYIEHKIDRPPVLSNLVAWPEDDGLQGARLGINDNNTTGRFLKHDYQLTETIVSPKESVVAKARELLASSSSLVLLNVSADDLLAIADSPEAGDDLLFNARATETLLRDSSCRRNVLHTMASSRMRGDALMQFFSKRKWNQIFLVEGLRQNDQLYANALSESAHKFGLKIRQRKKWLEDADIRRSANNEIPAFTQNRKYDVVVVADENRDFAQYFLYNTWLARPVAGSAGLQAKVWSPVIEQWGAAQLQSRFVELAERPMSEVDYANWVALRSIGEAVTRTSSSETDILREYILSPEFNIAAFKGKKMSFRTWNGQLRQPIALAHPEAVVAIAPIEGFLHQTSELDTLGLDQNISNCKAFK